MSDDPFKWTGPLASDLTPDREQIREDVKRPLPPECWPYGPPSFHESVCIMHTGGRFCDCKASEADDVDWGRGA